LRESRHCQDEARSNPASATIWHSEFDAEDAGMTAYVCIRYENRKGEAGQWGPVASAVIPCNSGLLRFARNDGRGVAGRPSLPGRSPKQSCQRYENRKGEAGQWGPVASAVIP
jgi:hypothetical protein